MRGACDLYPVLRFCCDIAADLVQAIGPGSEVVVHDLSQPESSIMAIAGDLTGRQVGGPLTDLVLRLLKSGRTDQNLLNYETKTSDGRILKSSTLFIHDERGKTVGCLCINQEITSWLLAKGLISAVCETREPLASEEETGESFPNDVQELLQTAIHQSVERIGKPVSMMDKNDKIRVVGDLDKQGIFLIRGAASCVAGELGVSRPTIYNYLEQQ